MQSLRSSKVRLALVPLMVASLSSACGTWAVQEIAPRHGGYGLYGSQASEHWQTGADARPPGSVCAPRMQLAETAYPHARWDPSGAQITAAVGIGAVWFIFAVVKPVVDDLEDIGDGVVAAVAPTLAGGQP